MARAALYLALLSPLLIPPSLLYPSTVFPAVFFRWSVAVACIGLIWHVVAQGRSGLTRDPVLLALLLYLAISAVSALLGYAPTRSLYGGIARMGGVTPVLFGVLYYASLRAFIARDEMTRYLGAAFAVGVAVGVIAIIQSVSPAQRLLWIPRPPGNPAGTLPNSGLLGGYLLVIFAIGVWLTANQPTQPRRLMMSAALVVVLYAFILPVNLASFLALSTATAIGAIAALMRISRRSVVVAILCGLGLLGALLLLTFVHPENVVTQAVAPLQKLSGMSLLHPTLVTRFDYWKAALNGFGAAPWLGAGPENFGLVFTRYHVGQVFESMSSGYEDRAHNVFFETLATMGMVGLLAYLAIWIALGLGLLRAYRRGAVTFAESTILAGLGVAFLLYLQMWFHELTTSIPLLALAALIAQRAETPYDDESSESEPVRPARPVLALLGALVIAVFTYQHTVPVVRGAAVLAGTVMATTFEEGARGLAGSDVQRIPETMEVATIDASALLDLTPQIGQIRADPVRLATVRTAIANADEQLEHLNQIDPRNDLWFIERGDIYVFAAQLTGEVDYIRLALEYYARAAELSPRRLTPWYKSAAAQLLLGDRMGAFAAVEEAKRVDPKEGRPHAFEARLYLAQARLDPAVGALRQAWELGYCETRSEINEILEVHRRDEAWRPAADLLADYYAFPCSDRIRTRADALLDPELRMEYPLTLLRAGRAQEAIPAAEETLAERESARPVVARFSEDVRMGWGSVWSRHPTLAAAWRELGAGPTDRPLAR